jgi:hypothetical protein
LANVSPNARHETSKQHACGKRPEDQLLVVAGDLWTNYKNEDEKAEPTEDQEEPPHDYQQDAVHFDCGVFQALQANGRRFSDTTGMGKEIDRVANGKFAPGRSANPGGRPATVKEVATLAREQTATAIDTLVDVAVNGRNEMARVKAAEALLNRGHGSPATETDLRSRDDDEPTSFTFRLGPDEIVGELVGEEDTA